MADESGWSSPRAQENFRQRARELAELNARDRRIAEAERAVIEAAKAWRAVLPFRRRGKGAIRRVLVDAIDALTEAERTETKGG